MAQGLNKVQLIGNLGADPELRVTPGGQSVLKLRIACSENYIDRNKNKQERTEWARCTLWGKRAESLGKILKKGERIYVEGRMQTSSYEKNGVKMYTTEVVVSEVLLLGS